MKTVYFIRHGQSAGNASIWTQQGSHTPLTPQGRAQAKIVASHMKRFPISAIIASPFQRAKDTAAELSKELDIPLEYSELFIERRRPSVQLTNRKLHPRSVWAQAQLSLFSRFAWYRHSDEETPDDLLKRAHEALAYLTSRPEETIAVVAHGRFMRSLHAAITLGEGVTGRAYLHATRTMNIKNTALMIAEFKDGEWQVLAWNVDAAKV